MREALAKLFTLEYLYPFDDESQQRWREARAALALADAAEGREP